MFDEIELGREFFERLWAIDAANVQRRMLRLEASAGARLFHRSPRGYALTEAGQDLLEHAQGMEELALSAWRKVVARAGQPIGVIRVATVDDVAIHVMPEIVASFREKHPNIMVSVDVRTSFHDLAKNEADVAFRSMIRAPEGDLIARKLVKTDAAIYASRAYLKKHGRPKTLEDLRAHDIPARIAGTPRTSKARGSPSPRALERLLVLLAMQSQLRQELPLQHGPILLRREELRRRTTLRRRSL